jgi:hypothetical protein
MPTELPAETKIRIMANFYFTSSDLQEDDFNPYEDIKTFLESTVGSMRWGRDAETRKHSKERYSLTLHGLLHAASITLSKWDILEQLENEDQTNQKTCEVWAGKAHFPPKHV